MKWSRQGGLCASWLSIRAQNYDSISFYILHFAMLGSNLRWSVQLQPDPMQKLCTCKNPQLGSALLIDVITHFSDSGTRDLDWILKPKFPYKSQRASRRAVSRAQSLPGPSQWWSIGAELPRPGLDNFSFWSSEIFSNCVKDIWRTIVVLLWKDCPK